MKIVDMLGPEMTSAFSGSLDSIPQNFFYETGAADLLAENLHTITSGNKLLVFSDIRTRAAAGNTCITALTKAGWSVKERVIPDGTDGSSPVADDITVNRLMGEYLKLMLTLP